MCGEAIFDAGHPSAGLSPRVRGSRRIGPDPCCYHRRVYPRVCGEARIEFGLWSLLMGLSPRVRGSRLAITWGQPVIPACAGKPELGRPGGAGSIPACAGKPSRREGWIRGLGLSPRVRGSRAVLVGVYPRVCGEAARPSTRRVKSPSGLSPRVRGSRGASSGSIPACAGKPGAMPGASAGSIPACAGKPSAWTGSIPACAGKPLPRRFVGSIPACAGKPRPPVGGTSSLSPRVRGSHVRGLGRHRGLSPRVRGSLCQIFDKGAALFSI